MLDDSAKKDIKRILIIEDNEDLLDIYTHMLEIGGFTVLRAKSGEEGIALSKESIPDIILLDIVMPEKDGFSVLADLKKDEKTRNIMVIMITNQSDPRDRDRAMALGADGYLIKTEINLGMIMKALENGR